MSLMAIDPGLDTTGVAIFDLERFLTMPKLDLRDALECLVGGIEIDTKPGEPIEKRLAELAHDLDDLVHEHGVRICYLETPSFEGDYVATHAAARRGPVNRMYEARGAILCTLGLNGVQLEQHRAGQSSKQQREETLEYILRGLGRKLPRGPRDGRREDIWDAMWIGAWALTTRVREDLKTPALTPAPLSASNSVLMETGDDPL